MTCHVELVCAAADPDWNMFNPYWIVERAEENAFEGGFPPHTHAIGSTKGCLNQLMGGNEFEAGDRS